MKIDHLIRRSIAGAFLAGLACVVPSVLAAQYCGMQHNRIIPTIRHFVLRAQETGWDYHSANIAAVGSRGRIEKSG